MTEIDPNEIDPNEISSIAEGAAEFTSDPSDFMKLIGNQIPIVEKNKNQKTQPQADPRIAGPSENDTQAMKELLEKFHRNVENNIDNTLRKEKDVQKALLKESNQGKEWHIILKEEKQKSYTIINESTKKAFLDNIQLYESAQKICNLLENNYALNSQKLQKILYYDNLYGEHFTECQNFKRLYKRAKMNEEKHRMRILSDRFEVTREKALNAKTAIKNIR